MHIRHVQYVHVADLADLAGCANAITNHLYAIMLYLAYKFCVYIYIFFHKVYIGSIRYKYTFVSLPMTCQKNILSAIRHWHHRIFQCIYNS